MKIKAQGIDQFAAIGTMSLSEREQSLREPKPREIPEKILPVHKGNTGGFKPRDKINTAKDLYDLLETYREKYQPFMEDHTVRPDKTRKRIYLENADWRIEDAQDSRDISRPLSGKGEWKRLSLPHYDEPLGRAVTYYRIPFILKGDDVSKDRLFICFKGVDYTAHVFVNGNYLGSHEGFFAPFEFDMTSAARTGENILLVKVENDFAQQEFRSDMEEPIQGDKIYAATGLGYDNPETGWHHCPPGMGIYQDVFIERRSVLFLHDIFVRPVPEEHRIELTAEVWNSLPANTPLGLSCSLYGQNFPETLAENLDLNQDLPAGPRLNFYTFSLEMPEDFRTWSNDEPWLYKVRLSLRNKAGTVLDVQDRSFGMRSFTMDYESIPKGKMYFNGRQIRLRGTNTMGNMQQCVFKKDWDQLRDDILLAKICNMNFFRLTQRPVQPEIYAYCDMLGMMTQTDLPYFGKVRKSRFAEGVKQAEEMERLVRSHPCNIIITYMNEPFPNANGAPQRNMWRAEMEGFFRACSEAVRLQNPDRVIKNIDGDYDPPTEGLPDNHCYCGWYNGHGLDIGKLHKGYWQKVKPGWMYGCGEFGAEGLDPENVMRKYYPENWLPQSAEEEKDWSPDSIVRAQSGKFSYMWYDRGDSLREWIDNSQGHQAWADRLMTEAFRRDYRMNTFAVHLFIDAFPAGWMKTIMDVDRRPKPAYFAYRECLEPLYVHFRTDRFRFFSEEQISAELWICNDNSGSSEGYTLHYTMEMDGKILESGKTGISLPECSSICAGTVRFKAPGVSSRKNITLKTALTDSSGNTAADSETVISVFPEVHFPAEGVRIFGTRNGPARRLSAGMGLPVLEEENFPAGTLIIADNPETYNAHRKKIETAVSEGSICLLLDFPPGTYTVGGTAVTVTECGMKPVHFVSRKTGHPAVEEFAPDDFKFTYDEHAGMVTPILSANFKGDGWREILSSGNGGWRSDWEKTIAVGEHDFGAGKFILCQVKASGRINSEPPVRTLMRNLLF
ncbi:MAG: glycosyl hydrolase 2 galactose-binding domain-containing protein [Spirochaetia bacterium]